MMENQLEQWTMKWKLNPNITLIKPDYNPNGNLWEDYRDSPRSAFSIIMDHNHYITPLNP